MLKMKHLLRKLHIGDHHTSPPVLDQSAQTTSSQLSVSSSSSPSPSPVTDLLPPTSTSEKESSSSNFNYLEEEFQKQLALAISVSDPGQTGVDSEKAQIDAIKQISLAVLLLKAWLNFYRSDIGADDEPVDPKRELEDRCKTPCGVSGLTDQSAREHNKRNSNRREDPDPLLLLIQANQEGSQASSRLSTILPVEDAERSISILRKVMSN